MKHLFLLFAVLTSASCSTMSYYWQALNGHAKLLNRQHPIPEVLADTNTRPEIKEKLLLVQKIRNFASQQLHLPDNSSYTQYADLGRPFALWNVVAAEKFSTQAKQWCFLFVGCLSYRGYYDEQAAATYAGALRQQGYDVMVSGARAYSTLGWFDDPLLSTMLYQDDARLAGIIFHELAHQQVYKNNASSFNEAFAMAVEIEGVLKWLSANHDTAAIQKYKQELHQQLQFNQLLRQSREKLNRLYKSDKTDSQKENDKKRIFIELQDEYHVLKQSWGGNNSYDAWMSQELNNAHLALIGTYYDHVTFFRNLLTKHDGNFVKFYQAVNLMSADEIKIFAANTARLAHKQ